MELGLFIAQFSSTLTHPGLRPSLYNVVEVLLYVHRNRRLIRDGEPRTATSTFTQLLSSAVPNNSYGLFEGKDIVRANGFATLSSSRKLAAVNAGPSSSRNRRRHWALYTWRFGTTWLDVVCGDKTVFLLIQSFFHAGMAYVANPHDICVHQAVVIQQQAQHIARLEQMLNTRPRQTPTTVQQSTQTDYMPNPSTDQFVQTDTEQTNTDQDGQTPPKVKTVRKSTQTTAKSTNCVVITGSRKRIALEDAKGVSLRKRRAEERTAFAKVATLFGGQDKSGISSVGVQVRYDDGTENKFVAWGKGASTDINELDTDTANTTDTGNTDTQNTTEGDTDNTHAEQNTTEQSTAETTDTATEDEEQQALQHTLSIVNLRNKFSISYRILHEFRMAGMPIPPRNVLQEQSVRLAGCVDIYQVPVVSVCSLLIIIINNSYKALIRVKLTALYKHLKHVKYHV